MPSTISTPETSRRYLIWSFAGIAVLFVAMAFAVVFWSARSGDKSHEIVENMLASVEQASRIGRDISSERILLNEHIIEQDLPTMLGIEAEGAAVDADLRAATSAYDSLATLPGENETWQELKSDLAQLRAPTANVYTLSRANRDTEARQALVALNAKYTEVGRSVGKLIDLNRRGAQDAVAKIDGLKQFSLGLFSVLGLAGFVVTLLVGRWSRSRMIRSDEQLNHYADELRGQNEALETTNWVRARHVALSEGLQGELAIEEIGARILTSLTEATGADVGAFWIGEATGFRRVAGYALDASAPQHFADGEGLVGQTARDRKVRYLRGVPADFLRLKAGIGERDPVEIVLLPASTAGQTAAVVELGFLHEVAPRGRDLVDRVGETVAVAVRSCAYRARLAELLEEARQQAEELRTQQEELRTANEELSGQGDNLREASNALQKLNADVERVSQYKSDFLANMSHELRTPLNSTLILAKLLAENAAKNLTEEQVSFARTIESAGHDLLGLIDRVLDLSKIEAGHIEPHIVPTTLGRVVDPVIQMFEPIARDKGLTLTVSLGDRDATFITDAQCVQQILRNLLSNAVKFTDEGHVSLRVEMTDTAFSFVVQDTGIGVPEGKRRLIFDAFRQADAQLNRRYGGTGLGLSISRKLAQLLGGDVRIVDGTAPPFGGAAGRAQGPAVDGTAPPFGGAAGRAQGPAVDGTAPPFGGAAGRAQGPAVDGTAPPFGGAAGRAQGPAVDGTAPPFGGAAGRAQGPAVDQPSKGSTFVVSLPRNARPEVQRDAAPPLPRLTVPAVDAPAFADDRGGLDKTRRVLLIVDADVPFAEVIAKSATELEFQYVVAHRAADAVHLAQTYSPSAIVLDLNLPDHSGLSVIDRLKRNPITRHIPIHVISESDQSSIALSMGAMGFLRKPVTRETLIATLRRVRDRLDRVRRLLVVEDDPVQRAAIDRLLDFPNLEIVSVSTVADALAQLASSTFDCVVTDLKLGDSGESGYDLLERMTTETAYASPPVIVYTGRSLTADEEHRLLRFSRSIIIKGARSPERLLDEVTLFLHQVETTLPPDKREMLDLARRHDAAFDGRTVVLAEDDVRNIFALTKILEARGAKVVVARNGREALEVIEATPSIDLVLMDVMMPEMDGLEAIATLRKRGGRMAELPIIVLTAKAMPDDRERCRAAGANDYIAKPIDVEVFLSLVRIWIGK